MVKSYEEALAFIHGRTQFKKIPTLSRMKIFMKKLNNPEQGLKIIHVAGTNGKGSTVAFLRSLLMETGQKVGTFTSPFLMRFNERISVNNQPISDEDLVDLVNEVQPIIKELDETLESGGPTEFEIITAMMFVYFAKIKVDVAVVEVGIGGKFDSTNVLTPLISVITTIGFDHMKLLGNTLPEIAGQKAGIIKDGVPVVVGNVPMDALTTIEREATSKSAPLFHYATDFFVKIESPTGWGEIFDYQFKAAQLKKLRIDLMGDYQVENAATALTAFILFQEQLKGIKSDKVIRDGLQKTEWPGRFELINQSPQIILDGAHNPPAMVAVTNFLKNRYKQQELYVILAILADKEFEKMVTELLSDAHIHLILTTFNGPGKRKPADPKTIFNQLSKHDRVQIADNWQLALTIAMHSISADDVILITGSLYFISEVRQNLIG